MQTKGSSYNYEKADIGITLSQSHNMRIANLADSFGKFRGQTSVQKTSQFSYCKASFKPLNFMQNLKMLHEVLNGRSRSLV